MLTPFLILVFLLIRFPVLTPAQAAGMALFRVLRFRFRNVRIPQRAANRLPDSEEIPSSLSPGDRDILSCGKPGQRPPIAGSLRWYDDRPGRISPPELSLEHKKP